MNRFLSVQRL